MLEIDLRDATRGPVETLGELAGDDPLLAGLHQRLSAPVGVTGRLQPAGRGRFYWQGTLTTVVAGECRRCLAAVTLPVRADVGALFVQGAGAADDPDTYPVPPDATVVDLRPAVREELLLAVPEYLLCRDDCRGLCPQCGKDLNTGPCGCGRATDPRWQALADLKDKPRD